MKGGVGWVGVVVALLTAAGCPKSTQAQETDGPRIGCFRGKPLPACRSFWITEVQGAFPVVQTRHTISFGDATPAVRDAFGSVVEWNVGHMVNLNRRWAVGGEVTVGSGGTNLLTGLRARGRRWLGPSIGVEAEVGVRWSDADHLAPGGTAGPSVGVRVNVRDQGAFFVRWDALSLSQRGGDGGFFDRGGPQHALSVGATAGSVPALVATGALGLGFAVIIALLAGSD